MVLNFDSITSKVPAKVFLLFWGKQQYFCPRNQKRLSEKTRASLAFLFKILYFEDMGKDVVCVSYRLGLAWGQAEIEAVTAAEKGLSLAGSGRRAVVVWRSYQADLQEESSPVHCAAVQRVHAFSYTNRQHKPEHHRPGGNFRVCVTEINHAKAFWSRPVWHMCCLTVTDVEKEPIWDNDAVIPWAQFFCG